MMLYKLVSEMQTGPFQSVVISLGTDGALRDRIEQSGTPVYEFGMPRGRPTLQGLRRLKALIREVRPALVQGWMYHGNIAALLARWFAMERVPVVWNVRQSLDDMPFEKAATVAVIRLGARLSPRIDRIIYNSVRSAEQHQAIGYSVHNSVVIANGFDTNLFRPSPTARAYLRRELALPEDAVLVGQIGRFHPMKGHETLLRAASLVIARHPHVYFVLAGAGLTTDNPVVAEMVERGGLRDRVVLMGERRDIPEITAGLDIACLASWSNEGFPNVVGEAMACGLPTVVTDVGDAHRIVADTGFVVPPRDAGSLADTLTKLLDMSAAERHAIGQRARARLVDQYSLPRIVRGYQNLYRASLGVAPDNAC